MMDISDIKRGPIVGREELRNDLGSKAGETGEETLDDDKDRVPNPLKRSLDVEFMISKKRRKQLKPIRITTKLEDMVKVPKQIVGLNNDLDNVNDLSHPVPKELSSKSKNSLLLDDVHFSNPLLSEASVVHATDKPSHAIDGSRGIDEPEITDLNVPSIEMGPNYITNPHFIFPLSFQTAKNPSFWSEANLKIFNQEAYCELCKKEFCNKYFLKTHKANKHGIYIDIPTSSATKPPAKFDAKDNGKISENGRGQGEGDCLTSYCDLCNKKFCNKYFVRRHKSKSHGLVEEDAQLPGFSLCQESETKIVQSPSHNNSTNETESTLTPQRPLALVQKENDYDKDNQAKEDPHEEEEGPLNLIVTTKGETDNEDDRDNDRSNEVSDKTGGEGDECSSENIEKLQTMLLRLNPSEIESKVCNVCNEMMETAGEHRCAPEKKDREYLSEGNDSSSESKSEFGAPKTENHDFMYMHRLDHLKQMKPTSSYCEICNKELCNKYFMKTHMQRMHGIEIEHGTQIGGVVCNICNKELCSKYFLRVHKQNTHGIMSPNPLLAPSTSGNVSNPRSDVKTSRSDTRLASQFSQVCCICNKRFRSPKWLQAHILSDHRDESSKIDTKEVGEAEQKDDEFNSALKIPKKNTGFAKELNESPEGLDVISKIFWENTSASKTYSCSQCSFSTSVLAFLFVHERSHFVLAQDQPEVVKPSVSLQNFIHDKTFWQHKVKPHRQNKVAKHIKRLKKGTLSKRKTLKLEIVHRLLLLQPNKQTSETLNWENVKNLQ